MSEQRQVHVKLVDEVVDVWRPVVAELLSGDTYRIADHPYDRASEAWEFEPGDVVVTELMESSYGPILVAKRLDSGP